MPRSPDPEQTRLLDEVVGYLNFSSGASDIRFLGSLNRLFSSIEGEVCGESREGEAAAPGEPAHQQLGAWLLAAVDRLESDQGAFEDVTQARAIVTILFDEFLPSYREFHRDLLHHQTDGELWRPYFLGRACEVLLRQGPPWTESQRIVAGGLAQLNDYVGYRPTATLVSGARSEPYAHEMVRPIPLYIQGVGVAAGRYAEILTHALQILGEMDRDLLARAWFDRDRLEEVALDPRAYDFDHPVNRRPNYHFGLWDPYVVDQSGHYTRFVLQQITLDALLARVEEESLSAEQHADRVYEAAAVLAGTMLMASGTCGDGPGCHDSTVTLATLLPHIAAYRDDYYQHLLSQLSGARGDRLRSEAERLRQPFGGARQHLNHELARRRALQIQRVHLALLFARIGRPQPALEQADAVRVASARMLTEIYCRLTAGHDAVDRGELAEVVEGLLEIEQLVHRAIECGALVDPWNIVGFAANFSLFPALENTVHDWRVDELIELIEQLLDLAARGWSEAAAVDNSELEESFSSILTRVAHWWDRYASSSVEGVRRLVAQEIQISANFVAGALNAWHKAGAAAGDVAFWRMFVEQFDTSKAFQLVIEALLDHGDTVASRALLMQWVNQRHRTPLSMGDAAFHPLAFRWLATVERKQDEDGEDRWLEVAKFFDYLEANAEEYWEAPVFRRDLPGWEAALQQASRDPGDASGENTGEASDEFSDESSLFEDSQLYGEDDIYADGEEDYDYDYDYDYEYDEDFGLEPPSEDAAGGEEVDYEDDAEALFGAAYEEMVYRDSTDDGNEGDIVEGDDSHLLAQWEAEARQLEQRLKFLRGVSRLWRHTAMTWGGSADAVTRREVLSQWLLHASKTYHQLLQLADSMHQRRIPLPSGTRDSLVEFDRLRTLKDVMMQNINATSVETASAARMLLATCDPALPDPPPFDETIDRVALEILRGVLAGDAPRVVQHWDAFIEALRPLQMLYLPHYKGGQPRQTVATRGLQRLVHDLLGWLPRLGLIRQTCELLDLAQQMESDHPVGQGAVTEFDRLFENGYQSIVRALIAAARKWDQEQPAERAQQSDHLLVDALQLLTERQLDRWLGHSRTLRLSVVEKLADEEVWREFVAFVEHYGEEIFTQSFLGSRGNLRGILHQGVEAWIDRLLQDDETVESYRFLKEMGQNWSRDKTIEMLTIAFEAVDENFHAYRDYNTTTTQSDQGDLLYVFVDFLRLRAGYDRVAWNLKPVVWAHEILVRQDRGLAADMWRQAFAERTREAADAHLQRLETMCETYGMRLPTVSERLHERFIRPLIIDRIRALVEPSMAEATPHRDEAFALLQREIDDLTQQPLGAGLDVPDWLVALEEEVAEARSRLNQVLSFDRIERRIGQVQLSWSEITEQLSFPNNDVG
jgi:hypothetical protein